MPRTIALLAALLSTVAFAQDLSAPPGDTLTPPPPPPQEAREAPPPDLEPAPSLRPLSEREPNRFRYTRGAIPRGFHLVEEPRWGLVAGGVGALAGSTAVMLLVALATRNPLHAVPLVGQFAAFADGVRTSSGWGSVLMIFGGLGLLVDLVAQVAGAVLLVVGFASPARWLERDAPTSPRLMLVPGAAGTPAGASLVGLF